MQTKLDPFQPSVEMDPFKSAKEVLENYVNSLGLVAYKDFYMKIKDGLTHIPEGLTAKVNRNNGVTIYLFTLNKT